MRMFAVGKCLCNADFIKSVAFFKCFLVCRRNAIQFMKINDKQIIFFHYLIFKFITGQKSPIDF